MRKVINRLGQALSSASGSGALASYGAAAGPIVIGALGGSGTRAIAEVLRRLGVYLGSALNESHDNLWFTLLCKRPRWLPDQLCGPRPSPSIMDALEVLATMMQGRSLQHSQLVFLAQAAADMAADGHDHHSHLSGELGFELAADYLAGRSRPLAAKAVPWGWKEPNSHLVLPELIECFPGLRYVHLVRHPLDMAFSSNTSQLQTWGHHLGLAIPENATDIPNAQLRWWIETTKMAIESGRALGERFRLLLFDEVCSSPRSSVKSLAAWCEIEVDPATIDHAASAIQTPASAGRWHRQGNSVLDPALLKEVRNLGFPL